VKPIRVGITGASGYIGRVVALQARGEGHDVVALGRSAPACATELRHCDLSRLPDEGLLDGLDGVIHLAADTSGGQNLATGEIAFAAALAEQASRRGIPLVVVSSQAASKSAPSVYGRTKAAIEAAVLPYGAAVVRPGMVYGGTASGLWGILLNAVRVLPFIPDLRPRPQVQPVHVADLAQALLRAMLGRYRARVFNVAGTPITFDRFLVAIAECRLMVCRCHLPLPAALLRKVLALGERLAGPRLSPQRLDSLTRLPPLSAENDLRELGVRLRALSDGMTRSGRSTRRLLLEGRSLMAAVLGCAPPRAAIRMYARAIRLRGSGRALSVPVILLWFPVLLAALDTNASRRDASQGGLARRISMATRIAETQAQCSALFVRPTGRWGRVLAALDISRAALRELQCRLVAPWVRRLAISDE
jgi:uncharacterized protein YbjT (DUF2867 family)